MPTAMSTSLPSGSAMVLSSPRVRRPPAASAASRRAWQPHDRRTTSGMSNTRCSDTGLPRSTAVTAASAIAGVGC